MCEFFILCPFWYLMNARRYTQFLEQLTQFIFRWPFKCRRRWIYTEIAFFIWITEKKIFVHKLHTRTHYAHWIYLCLLELFDSHRNTRSCNDFHFGSIVIIQANWSMNSETTSNGLLLVGSKTFIGQTSMYKMWLLFAMACLSRRWKWRHKQIFFLMRSTSQIIATYSSGVRCSRTPSERIGNISSLLTLKALVL